MTFRCWQLAVKCEQATPEAQHEMLHEAWEAIGPSMRPSPDRAGRFGNMMDAAAYESAAIELMPAGWRIDFLRQDLPEKPTVKVDLTSGPHEARGKGSTVALAIAAASLRAWTV